MGLAALARPRVRLVIDLGQMLKIEMGIDLRRRDIGVPQELLDRSQVARGFEQVARERMAQQMRMKVALRAMLLRPLLEPLLHGSRMDTLPARANE